MGGNDGHWTRCDSSNFATDIADPKKSKVAGQAVYSMMPKVNDKAVKPNMWMVLRNCGPRGYPGMAEVGNMALPRKPLALGIRDMVRLSDARMSGTAFGTVVLHVAPEAAAGGPLALVEPSTSMSRTGACTSTSRPRSWQRAGRGGRRPLRTGAADTSSSTAPMCSGRTRAPTSTSWWAAGAPKFPARAIECLRPTCVRLSRFAG